MHEKRVPKICKSPAASSLNVDDFQSFLYVYKIGLGKNGVVFSNRIHTFFSDIEIIISNHFRSFSIISVYKEGL